MINYNYYYSQVKLNVLDQRRIKYLTNNLRLNRDHIHIGDMKKKPTYAPFTT